MPTSFRALFIVAALSILVVGGLIATAVIEATSGGSTPSLTTPSALAFATRGLPRYWVVRSGDTYDSIAAGTHLSATQLQALNPQQAPNALVPGEHLKLHLPVLLAHARHRAAPRSWTVRAGDTYSSIAARTGVPVYDVAAYNPSVNPDRLSPGRRLKLRP